jgi:hypothetical protein
MAMSLYKVTPLPHAIRRASWKTNAKLPIVDLNRGNHITTRLWHLTFRNKIETVGALAALTPAEVLAMRGAGPGRVDEIDGLLRVLGCPGWASRGAKDEPLHPTVTRLLRDLLVVHRAMRSALEGPGEFVKDEVDRATRHTWAKAIELIECRLSQYPELWVETKKGRVLKLSPHEGKERE